MKRLSLLAAFLLAQPCWAQSAADDIPEDLELDRGHFGEVVTANEQANKDRMAAEDHLASDHPPRFRKYPILTHVTEVGGGLFAASTLGILLGILGDKIDPGDGQKALGGFHGPAIGAALGSAGGMMAGVWAGGLLFDKQVGLEWVALGTGAGLLFGTGTSVALAYGLGKGDRTIALSIASLLLFETGGALLLSDLCEPPALKRASREPLPYEIHHEIASGDLWFYAPLLQGRF